MSEPDIMIEQLYFDYFGPWGRLWEQMALGSCPPWSEKHWVSGEPKDGDVYGIKECDGIFEIEGHFK